MQTQSLIRKSFFQIEIAMHAENVCRLAHQLPSIGMLKTEFEELLKYYETNHAEESDPEISDEELILLIVKPEFEDLSIVKQETADYDTHPRNGATKVEGYIHYMLITFSFEYDVHRLDFDTLTYSPF